MNFKSLVGHINQVQDVLQAVRFWYFINFAINDCKIGGMGYTRKKFSSRREKILNVKRKYSQREEKVLSTRGESK